MTIESTGLLTRFGLPISDLPVNYELMGFGSAKQCLTPFDPAGKTHTHARRFVFFSDLDLGSVQSFLSSFRPTRVFMKFLRVSLSGGALFAIGLCGCGGNARIATQAPAITSASTASGTAGSAFTYQITATNSPTSYGATGLPAWSTLNTATGLITGTPTAAGASTVTLSATNSGGTGKATLTITVTAATQAPVITSASTASGTVGSAFSYQITATNSPTSYGATGLPAWSTLNTATGLITGTPTAAGTSTVTLSATNSGGTGNATLTITVSAATQAPVITSATTASGTVGSAFSYQITATNSPTSYGATGLPAWSTLNTATGLITGTPTAAGTSTVTLSATNGGGTGNATLTITITVAGPVTTSGVTPISGSTAGGAAVTITGTGFTAGATVSFGGVEATGVVVTSSTTITASTPTHGAGPVTVTVTNPGGASGSLVKGFAYVAALPLKNSANDRYFVDQNDTPWLMMADSPQGMICTIDASDMATYMSARASEGFNSINPDAICTTYTGGNSAGTAFDGTRPFTNGTSPANYDLSTPNPAYFAELDSLINLAGSNGLEVILDPIETGGWMGTLEINGPTKAYNYGAYLGNRYKSFPNVMWLSGNDFQTWSTSSTDNNLVNQVMAGIASTDSNYLQTVELNYFLSYSNQDMLLSSVLTDDGAYTYYETYDCVLQAYASTPTKPDFLIEANYEGENVAGNLPAAAGPYVLRQQAYWTLTSGGVGQIWGNRYFWGFIPGWQGQLSSPGALEIQYLNQLFDNVAWWNLVPDTTHEVVTAGYGTYDGSNSNLTTATYCTTSAAANGSLALTYCPNPSKFTVNLGKFSGPVTAEWYDGSDGAYTAISGSPFQNSGLQDFTTPGKNHDGDPDWILVMAVPAAN